MFLIHNKMPESIRMKEEYLGNGTVGDINEEEEAYARYRRYRLKKLHVINERQTNHSCISALFSVMQGCTFQLQLPLICSVVLRGGKEMPYVCGGRLCWWWRYLKAPLIHKPLGFLAGPDKQSWPVGSFLALCSGSCACGAPHTPFLYTGTRFPTID
jgi:hypothetical protein